MTVHRTRFARTAQHRTAEGTTAQHPTTGHGAPARKRAPLGARLFARLAAERGDVPGWVMITLMTAAIVVGLWAVASEQFVAIFKNALAPFQSAEF